MIKFNEYQIELFSVYIQREARTALVITIINRQIGEIGIHTRRVLAEGAGTVRSSTCRIDFIMAWR